jgi:hypothetical protein
MFLKEFWQLLLLNAIIITMVVLHIPSYIQIITLSTLFTGTLIWVFLDIKREIDRRITQIEALH